MTTPKTPPEDADALEFHPLTPDRWPDLEALFGPKGASSGCWCMFQRVRRRDYEAGSGEGNRAAFEARVSAGPPPGVLAYAADGEAVGWCSVAPRAEFEGLTTSRVLAPIDDAPVWSIHCFFVARDWRKTGLSRRLLRAACAFARAEGAAIVEAYPVAPKPGQARAPFTFTGVPAIYDAEGFEEVVRRSETRPIMRLTL